MKLTSVTALQIFFFILRFRGNDQFEVLRAELRLATRSDRKPAMRGREEPDRQESRSEF